MEELKKTGAEVVGRRLDVRDGWSGPVIAGVSAVVVGRRGRCVKRRRCMPADPGSIPGAGDKNKGLISLPCNIRRCALRG